MFLLKPLLSVAILIILIAGSFSDIKTRTVSNTLTGSIAILALLLIVATNNITATQIIISVLLFGYYYVSREIGGADVKALIPLIFIVSDPISFLAITFGLGAIFTVILYGRNVSWNSTIPFFIPVTLSYGIIVYNTYLLR